MLDLGGGGKEQTDQLHHLADQEGQKRMQRVITLLLVFQHGKSAERHLGYPTAIYQYPTGSNLKMWGLKNNLRYHHQLIMPVYQIVISLTYTKWSIPTTIGTLYHWQSKSLRIKYVFTRSHLKRAFLIYDLPGAYSGIDLNMRDGVFQSSPTSSIWQIQTVSALTLSAPMEGISVLGLSCKWLLEAKQVQLA